MSSEKVRHLVKQLVSELESTEGVDQETLRSAQQLAGQVDDLVDPEVDTTENTVMDDAIALEARFAASYPMAEKILRELVNSLSRIGI
ncbi:MAG: DUF4404 family protein [Gammaproteobacteria bacterium]